ncbi:hypothetical protein FACS189431_5800 [Alphaproteobacteria bacterium]|nr:hypothetical protein FACS189431_5800 [Alphaproteobacteria bacterium]
MTSARAQFTSARHSNGGTSIWGRNQNLTAYAPTSKLGPVTTLIIAVALIVVMAFMYAFQVMKPSAFSYEFYEIDQKRTELASERDDLRVENARLQSLTRVKDSNVAAVMTAPASTEYAN